MPPKKILQYTREGLFVRMWNSIQEICLQNKYTRSSIILCCQGKSPTAYDSIWSYYSDHFPTQIPPAPVRGETFKTKHGKGSQGHKAIQEKIKNTSLTRYSTPHPTQSIQVKQKYQETCQTKYQVPNAAQHPSIKEKISATESLQKTEDLLKQYPEINFQSYTTEQELIFLSQDCQHEFIINRQLLTLRKKNQHTICTICNPPGLNQKSEIERQLQHQIINKFQIDPQMNVKGLVSSRHELDVYFPEHQFGIEINGVKYHSDAYGKGEKYHLQKSELFAEQGIHILHFFDDEIIEKNDIVLSMIQNKLRLSQKIFGRRCSIQEVESSTARLFMDANHLQGNLGSSVKLGLFYQDQLVSMMTFGKLRNSLGHKNTSDKSWELLRFCNLLGYTVIGAASKLFNYFIQKYQPEKIITYANRRWSRGQVYLKMGFTLEGITAPNYWYFWKNKRIHRYGLRKDILVSMGANEKKSESQITAEMNIPKIYDCGNFRFIWKSDSYINP